MKNERGDNIKFWKCKNGFRELETRGEIITALCGCGEYYTPLNSEGKYDE
jgi:hypothetical protein